MQVSNGRRAVRKSSLELVRFEAVLFIFTFGSFNVGQAIQLSGTNAKVP